MPDRFPWTSNPTFLAGKRCDREGSERRLRGFDGHLPRLYEKATKRDTREHDHSRYLEQKPRVGKGDVNQSECSEQVVMKRETWDMGQRFSHGRG